MNTKQQTLAATAVTLACLGGLVSADEQSPPKFRPDDASMHPLAEAGAQRAITSSTFTLVEIDDGLRAIGPHYKADFVGGAMVYTAAFGEYADTNRTLELSLASIDRGGVRLTEGGWAMPQMDGTTALFERDGAILERFAAGLDGVELSYVFETLPSTAGDLVVRLDVASNLELYSADAEGIVFRHGDVGAITIGGVTGIAADGARAAGSLRLDGSVLELVLPDAFVRDAELPLVLDPLIGTQLTIAGAADNSAPDVAYELDNDLYLHVWERRISNNDIDVLAQRVDSLGHTQGGLISIDTANNVVARKPVTATVEASNRFGVFWQAAPTNFGPWDIQGRGVNAWDGGTTVAATISDGSGLNENADVGGEATVIGNDVRVVWEHRDNGIKGRLVTFPPGNAPPLLGANFSVTTSGADTKPAISKSAGPNGFHLIVWQRDGSAANDIFGRVIDRAGAMQTSAFEIAGEFVGSIDQEDPDVDGDGKDFLVAYEQEPFAGSGANSVRVKKVGFDLSQANSGSSNAITIGSEVWLDTFFPNAEAINPAVGFAGDKYFVAFAESAPGFLDYDLVTHGLDPDTCDQCEVMKLVDFAPTREDVPQIATQRSGSIDAGNELMLTWQSDSVAPQFPGDVRAQRLAVHMPTEVTYVGGGCGLGGQTSLDGDAGIGNKNFAIALEGADFAAPAAINILARLASATYTPCGPCNVLTPDAGTSVSLLPMVFGQTQRSIPIPCEPNLLGVSLTTQWIVLETTQQPCFFVPNGSASNRIEFTLGE